MSETLAAQTARLIPLAARALGWTPDIFWSSTPADLALALDHPAGDNAADGLSRRELDHLIESERHG